MSTFNSLQIGSFIASLAVGAYSLYLLFSDKYNIDVSNCVSSVDANADTAKQVCNAALKVSKAAVVVIYAITWLVQFCSWASSYLLQKFLTLLFLQMAYLLCAATFGNWRRKGSRSINM